MKPTLVFDIEVYKNYFDIAFLNVDTGNVRHLEMHTDQHLEVQTLRSIVAKYRLVSFNGNNFDMPLLSAALRGAGNAELKGIADKIIKNNLRHWQLGIDLVQADHIDLIEVAPGVASLKIYGGRLHCPKMQDLPIDPDASIAKEQRALLREYCENDLRTTLALFRKLEPQIALREQMSEQYGIDLRSKSDAQIAEAVIKHEVEKRMGQRLEKRDPFRLAGQTFQYKTPDFFEKVGVKFRGPVYEALQTIIGATFTIGGNGVVQMPKEIADLKIRIGSSTYRMGIGGLHSAEKSSAHFADADHVLVDRDVASYYPSIILNCGLKPAHMGDHFTQVYRGIVKERLAAKKLQGKIKERIATLEKELADAIAQTEISQAR